MAGRVGGRGPNSPNPWTKGGGSGQSLDVATEAAEVIEAAVTMLAAAVGWLLRHPASLVVLVGGALWWRVWGWPSLAVAVGGVVLAGVLWAWWWPWSWERWVWRHVRTSLLRMAVYELRWPRWARASRLVLQEEARAPVVPRVRSVRSGRFWDTVRVRMLPGQTQQDYEMATESLAQSRRVARCTVREIGPGVVELGFLRRDPLLRPVSAPEITTTAGASVDVDSVPMGRTEHGAPWRMPVLGSHLLGAGMTGAGKGSLLWQPVRMLAPAIRDGRVRISMIDPKGGMEAEIGTSLYSAYARDEPGEIVDVLTARVEQMRERAHRLRGQVRKHTPTVHEPLDLIIIDELAAVTKYLGDKKKQVEAERLLGILLTQGRALASVVHAFVQEPTKEIVPMRGLFPYRVGLRLDTPIQADMVLGDGAWQRGAWCDRIPRTTPGIGYVVTDGQRQPERVRSVFTSDDEIRRIAREYPSRH